MSLTVLTIVLYTVTPSSYSDLVTGQWRSHPHGKIFPAAQQKTPFPHHDSINLALADLLGQFYPLGGAIIHKRAAV